MTSKLNDNCVGLPTTRAEALKLGVPRFFDGTPCRRGHVVPRLARNRGCVACKRMMSTMPKEEKSKLMSSKQYSTGRPCLNGHYSKRYSSSRECVECKNAARGLKPSNAPRPFVHILKDWSPVMVNVVRLTAASSA